MQESGEKYSVLLTQILRGSKEAERKLIKEFERSLYSAMRYRIGDDTLAEDVCQETWRILLVKFRQAGPLAMLDIQSLPAYIHNTAFNIYLAELRRRERHRTDTDSDSLQEMADETGNDFLEQVSRHRLQLRLREVIDGLHNARDKLILYRYYIQEQSKEQICKELELDSRHFDRIAHRARERLRKLVETSATDLQEGFIGELLAKLTPASDAKEGEDTLGK